MSKVLKKQLNDRYSLVEKKISLDIHLLNQLHDDDHKAITKWYDSGSTWADMSYRMLLDDVDIVYDSDLHSKFLSRVDRFDDVFYPDAYGQDLLDSINTRVQSSSHEDALHEIKASELNLLVDLRNSNPKVTVVITNRHNEHPLTVKGAITRLKKFQSVITEYNKKANQVVDTRKATI